MAFSRRVGAFSAAASSQKAAAPETDKFTGDWIDEDGATLTIKGKWLTAADGNRIELTVKSETVISMVVGGEAHTGSLQPDGGLLWSDNCLWQRKAQASQQRERPREGPEVYSMVDRTPQDAALEAAKPKSQANMRSLRQAYEAEKESTRTAAGTAPSPAAREGDAATKQPQVAEAANADEMRARSEAGLEKARQAREAEKARKAAALERIRAEKAAAAAAVARAPPPPTPSAASDSAQPATSAPADTDDARARSELGLERARQAREAEKARKAAALERVRAEKAAAAATPAAPRPQPATGLPSGAPSSTAAGAEEVQSAQERSEAGAEKARLAREAERARKAAALERVRAEKAAAAAAEKAAAEEKSKLLSKPPKESAGPIADKVPQAEATPSTDVLSDDSIDSGGEQLPEVRGATASFQPPERSVQPQRTAGREVQGIELEPGMVVRLFNLHQRTDLNGLLAQIVNYSEETGRWEVQVEGMGEETFNMKTENLKLISQEEFDKWQEEQARIEESSLAKADISSIDPLQVISSSVAGNGMVAEATQTPGPLKRQPAQTGNHFDASLADVYAGVTDVTDFASQLAGKLLQDGMCVVEAGCEPEQVVAAYDEALKARCRKGFAPPMQGMGASEVEELLWKSILYKDEQEVLWLTEEQQLPSLLAITDNMVAIAQEVQPLLAKKGVKWSARWDGMVACYTGKRKYSFHLDNPRGGRDALPDNGLRLTMCSYINTHWEFQTHGSRGGVDLFCHDASARSATAAQVRQAPRIRVAAHADTVVMFLSDRTAHQVVETVDAAESPWFCVWLWFYDEAAQQAFPEAAWSRYMAKPKSSTLSPPAPAGADESSDDEVIDVVPAGGKRSEDGV